AKYTTAELLEREGAGPVAVAPFTRYLKGKLGDVYGLQLAGWRRRASYRTNGRDPGHGQSGLAARGGHPSIASKSEPLEGDQIARSRGGLHGTGEGKELLINE